MIPGPGPAQEVFIQQAHPVAHEVVLVEDTDESDDEVFLPPGQVVNVQIDQNAYHPLAIVPFVPPANQFFFIHEEEQNVPVVQILDDAVKEKTAMRRLLFDDNEPQQVVLPVVSAPEAEVLKKKREKIIKEVPESEASVRRSTRQSVKRDGFKLEPMRDKVTPPKKKPRSTKPRIPKLVEKNSAPPHTPMSTLKKVGTQLEIYEDELTVEKLMAAPVEGKGKKVVNE
jgi:hypothetical protein